jgi:hypothetical protein
MIARLWWGLTREEKAREQGIPYLVSLAFGIKNVEIKCASVKKKSKRSESDFLDFGWGNPGRTPVR